MTIREKLIAAGVKNLKEFGYPHVNEQNILTDEVYKAFFANMVRDNIYELEDIAKVNSSTIVKQSIETLKQLQKELNQ